MIKEHAITYVLYYREPGDSVWSETGREELLWSSCL